MLFENFLKTLPGFRYFSLRDIDNLAHAMRVAEYEDGHVFIYQGKQGKEMFLLVEGKIRISRYDELTGENSDLKVLQPGELFGLLSLTDDLPAAASCIADGSVKVASLPRSAYKLLFRSAAPIAYHFQYLVAQQLARDLYDRNQALRSMLKTG